MTYDKATISFLEKLNSDPSLQEEVAAAIRIATDKTGAVIALAQGKGYAVGRESFETARAVLNAAPGPEGALSDRQLESVAGGFNPQPEPPGGISAYSNVVRLRSTLLSW